LKTARYQSSSRPAPARATAGGPARELAELRARLADAEETVRAIRSGEVDAVVVAGKQGPQVFTLEGAEHAYRVLIESMNEGALTLTAKGVILYANRCFSRMVKCPLEQVMGGSFRRFLSAADRATLRPLLQGAGQSGSKIQVLLHAGDGSKMPAQISIRPLAKDDFNRATIGLVVTDMTEARRNEEMLRALTHRVVQVQEAERGRLALELHDNITQLLCGVLFHSQALADSLSAARDGPSKGEAMKLREMLGQTAEEVERISHDLRPSILDQLGLGDALRDCGTQFESRTGVSVKLACVKLAARLPADTELALYRILQEALENVKKHARARHVTVRLRLRTFVELAINDDGIGFDPEHPAARRKGKGGLGLLSMRERATYVGGTFKIKSVRGVGTEIEVRIPLPAGTAAAD
jgi:two-component system NarL family sensor kinase